MITCTLGEIMEIDFVVGHFRNIRTSVTLTLVKVITDVHHLASKNFHNWPLQIRLPHDI